MKKFSFLVALVMMVVLTANAQTPRKGKQYDSMKIENLVDNLSNDQKRKLNSITEDSKQRLDKLNARKRDIRDSIFAYMQKDGDYSTVLYALFEREAKIQVLISKEMYAMRMRIDGVLDKEQRAIVQEAFKKRAEGRKGRNLKKKN